jgi:hypothetical protein
MNSSRRITLHDLHGAETKAEHGTWPVLCQTGHVGLKQLKLEENMLLLVSRNVLHDKRKSMVSAGGSSAFAQTGR